MTSRVDLPLDLKKEVRSFVLKRVLSCIVLLIVFGMILLFFGDKIFFHTEHKAFQRNCYILIILVPFFITGVPFKLFDRTYIGTVDDITIRTRIANSRPSKPTIDNYYDKNIIYLTIVFPNGKKSRKKVFEGDAKRQQNLNTFQKGDRVFHLYGSKHTIVLPKKSDTRVHCAVCGSSNDKSDSVCAQCGHTLIM